MVEDCGHSALVMCKRHNVMVRVLLKAMRAKSKGGKRFLIAIRSGLRSLGSHACWFMCCDNA